VTSKPLTAIDIIPATSPKPTSLPPLHVACASPPLPSPLPSLPWSLL
jgi:hypothetical protein